MWKRSGGRPAPLSPQPLHSGSLTAPPAGLPWQRGGCGWCIWTTGGGRQDEGRGGVLGPRCTRSRAAVPSAAGWGGLCWAPAPRPRCVPSPPHTVRRGHVFHDDHQGKTFLSVSRKFSGGFSSAFPIEEQFVQRTESEESFSRRPARPPPRGVQAQTRSSDGRPLAPCTAVTFTRSPCLIGEKRNC